MKKNKHKGSCFCGNIQFEIKDTGGTVAACHCLDCRKASGAPFMIFVVVDIENYMIKNGNSGSIRYADGIKMRTFCSNCGSALTYENKHNPDDIHVNVALLEKPEDFQIQYHVWIKRKLPGVKIVENVPVYLENSDRWKELHGD